MKPWYKGYQGSIEKVQDKAQYIITGNFEVLDDTQLEITELPIGKWTRDYKEMLEEMAQDEKGGKIVENIREYHQQNRVHFIVDVPTIRELAQNDDSKILKNFRLQSSISGSNYVLFDSKGKIARYKSEIDILKEFFRLRTALYNDRKEYMLAKLLKDYEILFNKVKFIQAVIAGTIKINKVKRQQIMLKCKEIGLKSMVDLNKIMDPFIKDKKKQARIVSAQEQTGSGDEAVVEEVKENEIPVFHYDYLLSMPLWSLTEERVIDLENQMNRKKDEHDMLQKRTIF